MADELALFEHWSEGKFDFSASEKNVILFAEMLAQQGKKKSDDLRSVDSPKYYQERLHTLGRLWCEDALDDIAMDNKIRHHQLLLKGPSTPDDVYFMWQINCHFTYRFVPKKLDHDNSTLDDQSISAPQTAWPHPSQELPPTGQSPLQLANFQELQSTMQMPVSKTMEP